MQPIRKRLEKLFFDPEEYYRSMLVDIDRESQDIILETYMFRLDEVGQSFLTALIAASKRGVGIRLLVDGIGSYRDASRLADRLESENCQVRIFHPLPWDFPAYRRALTAGHWYSQALHFFFQDKSPGSSKVVHYRRLHSLVGQL